MRARISTEWLSLTPEPERELPTAIAALRAGGPPAAPDVARERERAEALVLHGSEAGYVQWLAEAAWLAAQPAAGRDPALAEAAEVVRDVVSNQAGLLLGLRDRRARRARAGDALLHAAGAVHVAERRAP